MGHVDFIEICKMHVLKPYTTELLWELHLVLYSTYMHTHKNYNKNIIWCTMNNKCKVDAREVIKILVSHVFLYGTLLVSQYCAIEPSGKILFYCTH